MKKPILTVLALMSVMAFSTGAQANDGPKHHGHRPPHCMPGKGPGGPGGPGQMFFKRFDLNGDGKVTKAEFDKASAKFFAKMDANKDGVITRDEFRKGWEARMEKREEFMRDHRGPHEGWGGPEGRGPMPGHMGWRHRPMAHDYSHANDDNGQ